MWGHSALRFSPANPHMLKPWENTECRISPREQSSIMDEVGTFPVLGNFFCIFWVSRPSKSLQELMEIITKVFRGWGGLA